jgi:hypothetical protein
MRRAVVPSRWSATLSKTCASARGLVLRQVSAGLTHRGGIAAAMARAADLVGSATPACRAEPRGRPQAELAFGPNREGRDDRKLPGPWSCAPHRAQGGRPRRRGGISLGLGDASAGGRGGLRRGARRPDLERRILGQEGRGSAQSLAQAGERAEAGRAAAAGPVPGAWLLELRALVLRPRGAGQGRVFADERHGPVRLRRLDHGPRRLRLFRQLRKQFRRRERRRGPQGGGPGGGAGDRAGEDAFLRHVVGRHPRRRLRAGRARAGRPPGATKAPARPRSAGASGRSRSIATTIAASATPR